MVTWSQRQDHRTRHPYTCVKGPLPSETGLGGSKSRALGGPGCSPQAVLCALFILSSPITLVERLCVAQLSLQSCFS